MGYFLRKCLSCDILNVLEVELVFNIYKLLNRQGNSFGFLCVRACGEILSPCRRSYSRREKVSRQKEEKKWQSELE